MDVYFSLQKSETLNTACFIDQLGMRISACRNGDLVKYGVFNGCTLVINLDSSLVIHYEIMRMIINRKLWSA